MKLRAQSPLWRRVLRLAGRQLFRLAENNDDPQFARNGERWLLGELLQAHARAGGDRPFVACDAGANVGDYTREVLRGARSAGCRAAVHVFEPSPACAAALERAFAAEPAVRLVRAAVGAGAGAAVLHDGAQGSSQASLVPRPVLSGQASAAITVPVISLADYFRDQGLARVDLLKLDVEGSELAALRGLGAQLDPAVVDVIQFEYGGAALDAGTTLRECYALLEARGFVLAKLFPDFLEVRPFRPWMEHYAYANYVALAPRWLAGRAGAP